jgi:hypothetical protein
MSDVEYRAFLNMWLCRFIFCGKANEPTLNHIVMAEDLAAGTVDAKRAPGAKHTASRTKLASHAQRVTRRASQFFLKINKRQSS